MNVWRNTVAPTRWRGRIEQENFKEAAKKSNSLMLGSSNWNTWVRISIKSLASPAAFQAHYPPGSHQKISDSFSEMRKAPELQHASVKITQNGDTCDAQLIWSSVEAKQEGHSYQGCQSGHAMSSSSGARWKLSNRGIRIRDGRAGMRWVNGRDYSWLIWSSVEAKQEGESY